MPFFPLSDPVFHPQQRHHFQDFHSKAKQISDTSSTTTQHPTTTSASNPTLNQFSTNSQPIFHQHLTTHHNITMVFLFPSRPSSIFSGSSSTSSTRAIYSKDGQGYDFTSSYPSSISTSPSSTPLLPTQPFKRNLYAKDGRGLGLDFAETYTFDNKQTRTAPPEFSRASYSKDGQGFDFSASYAARRPLGRVGDLLLIWRDRLSNASSHGDV